jgi:hypothetical protein
VSFVDLHLHSVHSDGSDTPARIVARALEVGASAIALTDHDTVSGVGEGREAALASGLGFLSGTEISTHYKYREIHVIGLGVDETEGALTAALEGLCASRRNRGRIILGRLRELGYELPTLAGQEDASEGAFGRMHIARAMTDAGHVRKPQEAFDRFMNAGRPAFVPKETMPLAEAVDLIHGAGGLAFVAHPGLGKTTRKLLPELLTFPFDGIEAYHISHSPGRVEEFSNLARERGLLITGGSDCHGTIKGKALLGSVRPPLAIYEAILNRLAH